MTTTGQESRSEYQQGQHTAGPWVEYRRTQYLGRGVAVDKWHVNGDGDTTRVADEIDDEANARLIAAAPDLLAALELIAELHDNGLEPDEENWLFIEAAIRKARGED